MSKEKIMLRSIEAVKQFVGITNKYPFEILLVSDKYRIDAKSIMGVFSMDLSRPVSIEITSDDPHVKDCIADLEPFKKEMEEDQ